MGIKNYTWKTLDWVTLSRSRKKRVWLLKMTELIGLDLNLAGSVKVSSCCLCNSVDT